MARSALRARLMIKWTASYNEIGEVGIGVKELLGEKRLHLEANDDFPNPILWRKFFWHCSRS